MRVLLANPRGFCAGVKMAIEALDTALRYLPAPVYVYHQIVHNRHVVERYERQGVVFVDDVGQVPEGCVLMFSAHGVSPAVRRQAKQRRLQTIDSTCPLVAKVHLEAIRFAREGYQIILVGSPGHDETLGTVGEAPQAIQVVSSESDVDQLEIDLARPVAYLTQTTLSVDDTQRVIDRLRRRFPRIVGPATDDICYATQNRQQAVRAWIEQSDVVIVVGSQNSSNSRRLQQLAQQSLRRAVLVDAAADLQREWFRADDRVLVTAGASAPEFAVRDVVNWLRQQYRASVSEGVGEQENERFSLPRELRSLANS